MGNLHRIGAAVVGGFVFVFGLTGLTWRPEVFSTEGPVVFGMTTNGFLAFLSMAVGFMLVFAAVFGGPVAAWGAIAAGAGFILSGVVNVFLLGTPLNVMAFTMPNVVFSWVAGAVLVALGMIGRKEHPTDDSLYGSQPGARGPGRASPHQSRRRRGAGRGRARPRAALRDRGADRAVARRRQVPVGGRSGPRMGGVGSPSRVAVGVARGRGLELIAALIRRRARSALVRCTRGRERELEPVPRVVDSFYAGAIGVWSSRRQRNSRGRTSW